MNDPKPHVGAERKSRRFLGIDASAPGRLPTIYDERIVGYRMTPEGVREPVKKTWFIGHGQQLAAQREAVKKLANAAFNAANAQKPTRQVDRRIALKARKQAASRERAETIRTRRQKAA